MTHGEISGYWAAIAQIVPVLALAFVVEARFTVARLSKKSNISQRKTRVAWASLFLLLAVGLAISEFAAIQSLASPPEKPLSEVDTWYFRLSGLVIYVALLVVVTIPIGNLVASSTGDVARWLAMHVPWGEPQRLRRDIFKGIDELERQLKEIRNLRSDALLAMADVLLVPRRVTPDALEYLRTEVETFGDADSLKREQLQGIVESDPDDPQLGYRLMKWYYENLGSSERRTRKYLRASRKRVQRLDAIISVNSPDTMKQVRRVMREAALAR